MNITRVKTNRQVTILSEIAKKMHIEKGNLLRLQTIGSSILLTPMLWGDNIAKMVIVRVREKMQITIPCGIAKETDMKEGDFIELDTTGKRIIIIPRMVVNDNRNKVKN